MISKALSLIAAKDALTYQAIEAMAIPELSEVKDSSFSEEELDARIVDRLQPETNGERIDYGRIERDALGFDGSISEIGPDIRD